MAQRTTSSRDSITTIQTRVDKKLRRASELNEPIRMLIYGASGKGKTRLAASAPDVILIDVNEHGTKSTQRDFDPHVYQVEMWSDIDDIFWYLRNGDHSFTSFAIDGVTSMQNLCMKFVLGDEQSRDATRLPDTPSRQAWGRVGELMKTQITNFRNLPMNGVFTALQRTRQTGEEDADIAEMIVTPDCSPSVAGHLEAAVDIIGHLTSRQAVVKTKAGRKTVVERRLLLGPSERYVTKDRSGLFPSSVKGPALDKMFTIIQRGEL